MKKQPLDSLTEQDRYNIRKYIYLYTNCNCGPLDIVLGEWNQSKRRLYHAFGNQLRVKKKIKIEHDTKLIKRELKSIYNHYIPYSEYDMNYVSKLYEKDSKENFYINFFIFITNIDNISYEEKINILNLFSYRYIIDGYIKKSFKLTNYNFSVRDGAKTIRTIQKCLKALKYPRMDLFEEWRNDINTINSNRLNEATLVLSINPIDFMTMSDNQCNWTSCMSWISPGCHSAGTIEMMNSNVAVVAYLEANKKFKISLDENNQLIMPNKSWRSLIYCHKQIILTGKSYPYYEENISKEALNFMKEIVYKSFNWTYQFDNQEYKDVKSFHNNYFLKFHCSPNYHHGSKKIIIYTDGMYNDIIEDTGSKYWCCRNATKGLRINLSGQNTCMCCGRRIIEDYDEYEDNYLGSGKICFECLSTKKCPICKTINYKTDNEYHLCSEECKDDALVFPGQNCVISRTKFLSKIDLSYIIFARNEQIYKKATEVLRKVNNGNTKLLLLPYQIKAIKEMLMASNIFSGKDYVIKTFPKILFDKYIISVNSLGWDNYYRSYDQRYVVNVLAKKKEIYTSKYSYKTIYLYSCEDALNLLNKSEKYYRYNERRD